MTEKKKSVITGVKPTGKIHIGNYLGAIKPFLNLQDKYDCGIFIADLHALTSVQNGSELSELSLGVALDFLALGLNPKKTLIFKQSDTPEVTELAWIFNCITTCAYLMRAHAFKDAEAKNKEINVGTFEYPLLMAADILIRDADFVPVGLDQKQHIEYARDTAEKFNRIFGETFKLPEALIYEEVKTVPGIDGRKMSKSYGNTIELFAEDSEIEKAVMSIKTDSKGVNDPKNPDEDNIFNILKHFADSEKIDDVRRRYEKGGIGYKETKEILIETLVKFITPIRERRKELAKDKKGVLKILEEGGKEAKKKVGEKMRDVRDKVGLIV